MKTATVKIRDKEYLLCFSTQVLIELEERSGDAQAELSRILNDMRIKDMFWLLHTMMRAGAKYAELEEKDNPPPLTFEELVGSVGIDEYESMFDAVSSTVAAGTTPDVEVKTPKNVKTTRVK